MNNLFNLTRFGRLFIKHTVEHYKSYLMSLIVLISVMILGGSFLIYMIQANIDIGLQTAFFTMILLLAGTIFTSTVFADMGDRKKAVASLTLPASHFEKYLVAWVYSFVVFLIVNTACFYLVVVLAVNIKHFPGHPTEILNVFIWPIIGTYLLYAFLHSIAFYGAIFFEKLHFIKTGFIFFIFIAILILFNKLLLGALLGEKVEVTVPFGNLRFIHNGNMVDINVTQQYNPYLLIFITVMALIFWVAAYYRLKEKQV
jgi:hypothetical protein